MGGFIRLVAERDVEQRDGGFHATGVEPWLAIADVPVDRLADRFVEITYRLSLWDDPVRPVFRFWREGAPVDRIAAGPVAGRASWIGRVPPGTTRISVSPTTLSGRFDFAIERIRVRRWASLLVRGFRWHPRPTRSALLTRLIGWRPESDVNLAWAIGSTPVAGYELWRRTHERSPELSGFDRPRFDWAAAAPIRVIISCDGTGDDDLRRSLASLDAQLLSNWEAVVVGAAAPRSIKVRTTTLDDLQTAIDTDGGGFLSGFMRAGDVLVPQALAVVAERAHRNPAAAVFYGDEASIGPDGATRLVPKPGWSPRLQEARPYLGRPVFVRDLAAWDRPARHRFLASGDIAPSVVRSLPPDRVLALRRVLAETLGGPPGLTPTLGPASTPASATTTRATIIIPTRDHPALLRRVVASIRARSRPDRFRIVVVDNASVDRDARALLDDLRSQGDVRVVDFPGPFNFSRICNEAAAQADGDVLVFLNDDTQVLSDSWLDRLVAHAMDDGVGAVGARLTYPDGRLQHVGVVLGMGESAGHFGALALGDDPGWMNRNQAIHEVSAVTGACLVVAREKFEAVGGFDAVHLPIELSDIDLCLKLNARGWQTIVDPSVHLMHEESATRGGATLRRLAVHDRERAVFVERWRHILRDDPLFHPGLSLYRWQAALA